jgi:hypothetical protein
MHEYMYYLIIGAYPVASYTGKVLFLQEPVELHSKEWLTMILLHSIYYRTVIRRRVK